MDILKMTSTIVVTEGLLGLRKCTINNNIKEAFMMRFILAAGLALGMGVAAHAGELDNEAGVTNKQLTGTLVLRVDSRTHQSSFVKSANGLRSESEAKALAHSAKFTAVPAGKIKSELDQEGGASSWYFYSPYQYPYYTPTYQPACNWYGNSYNPYYSYNYGNYNYYYYGYSWSYWR
jgi:hypothetical protein